MKPLTQFEKMRNNRAMLEYRLSLMSKMAVWDSLKAPVQNIPDGMALAIGRFTQGNNRHTNESHPGAIR